MAWRRGSRLRGDEEKLQGDEGWLACVHERAMSSGFRGLVQSMLHFSPEWKPENDHASSPQPPSLGIRADFQIALIAAWLCSTVPGKHSHFQLALQFQHSPWPSNLRRTDIHPTNSFGRQMATVIL